MEKMKIIVSACLLGESCRYDGQSKTCREVAELSKIAELIPICPECLGGLPTPREPSEQRDGRVYSRVGEDVTDAFRLGAERALGIARENGAMCAVLKERSPSCGKNVIYDGSFSGKLTEGMGTAAELIMKNGIKVYGESEVSALLSELKNMRD